MTNTKMTNSERAEKMHAALYCHFDREGYDKKDVDKILIAGLDEAREDGLVRGFDKGFAAAREQALEIYRKSGTSEEVEARLRAMRAEEK